MHQLLKKYCAVVTVATLGFSAVVHAGAPSEKTSATLTRTSTSGVQVSEALTKNIYRQQAQQVPYTVQEPYEDTETYYENVPYQETETYYENVPYQDTETYTENVPYQDTETYTENEEYNDSEYRCETRSRDERVCHDVEDCHIVPGPGPGGGPRRECTRSPACENVSRPYQDCGYVTVRRTRPVTRTRTVTRYRQETRTRSVTHYRQEQRTRTVTKYRQEERTRTVTRYHEREVCCKTVYKDVFDHQQNLQVIVNFPADSALQAAEKETFTIQLGASEAAPTVAFKLKDTIFGYTIAQQGLHGGAYVIDLARAPLYTPDQLGAATIKNLNLQQAKVGATISFTDSGLKPRIDTAYSYQVHEVGSTDILAQGNQVAQQSQVAIPLQITLEDLKEYQVDVRVARQGLPLSANVDFTVSAVKKIAPLKDAAIFMKKDKINTFEVRGEAAAARLFFRDQTPTDQGVHTTYKLEILAGSASSGVVVATKELTRDAMSVTSKGFFLLKLGDDLGVPADVLSSKVRAGKTVTLRMTVTREHAQLNEGQPVVLKYSFTQLVERE